MRPPKVYAKPLRVKQLTVARWTDKGLGRTASSPDCRSVDLFGVYPGEELQVLVGRRGNAWPYQITKPVGERREPICNHFGSCGGCTLQSLDYAAQLELKTRSLLRKLKELAPDCVLLEPVPSPTIYHYRSKVEFSFQQNREGCGLGFHWRGRFDHVVNVQHCYIAPPPQEELLRRTRQWVSRHGLTGWHPRSQTGNLRYLVLRRARTSGEWLAVLVTGPEVEPEAVRDWAASLQDLGPRALLWARQTTTACAVKPDSQELLCGTPWLREDLGSLHFQLGWQSFFQTNPAAYLKLLETARDWCPLKAGQSLLDLFCGIGTIGMFLKPQGGRLIGVESVPEAVEDARAAATLNQVEAEFHCCPSQDWPDLNCDLLVLDPPRSGCHPKLVERVVGEGPRHILYVSCNPTLWLKEAEQLSQAYRIVKAQPFDFFPQTRHVELLALLERR